MFTEDPVFNFLNYSYLVIPGNKSQNITTNAFQLFRFSATYPIFCHIYSITVIMSPCWKNIITSLEPDTAGTEPSWNVMCHVARLVHHSHICFPQKYLFLNLWLLVLPWNYLDKKSVCNSSKVIIIKQLKCMTVYESIPRSVISWTAILGLLLQCNLSLISWVSFFMSCLNDKFCVVKFKNLFSTGSLFGSQHCWFL